LVNDYTAVKFKTIFATVDNFLITAIVNNEKKNNQEFGASWPSERESERASERARAKRVGRC